MRVVICLTVPFNKIAISIISKKHRIRYGGANIHGRDQNGAKIHDL